MEMRGFHFIMSVCHCGLEKREREMLQHNSPRIIIKYWGESVWGEDYVQLFVFTFFTLFYDILSIILNFSLRTNWLHATKHKQRFFISPFSFN